MMVQVTAYVVLDRLVVQASAVDATPEGARSWTRLVFSDYPLAAIDDSEAWDALWALNQCLSVELERRRKGDAAPF